jgi:hypothetical protein
MTKPTNWIKGHQIVAFFILTFAITWGIGAFAILFPAQVPAMFGELTGFSPLFILAAAAPFTQRKECTNGQKDHTLASGGRQFCADR